jgi:anti-sigma B factor antagonist
MVMDRRAESLWCQMVRLEHVNLVRVQGEIDVSNIYVPQDVLAQALRDRLPLVIDLSRVTYLDSTALNVLMGIRDRCRIMDVDLALVFTSQAMREVFSALSLHEVFNIFPGVDDAVRLMTERRTPDAAAPQARAGARVPGEATDTGSYARPLP